MDLKAESQEYSSQEIANKTCLTQDMFTLNVDENNSEILLYTNIQKNVLEQENSQVSDVDSEPLTKKVKVETDNNTHENDHLNSTEINNTIKLVDPISCKTNNILAENENCNTEELKEIENYELQSSKQSVNIAVEVLKENDCQSTLKSNMEQNKLMQNEESVGQTSSSIDKIQNTIDDEEPMCIDQLDVVHNYDFDKKILENNKLMELSRISWKSDAVAQRYTRGIIWSPDGTCALTAINADGMQIFELPNDLYSIETIEKDRGVNILKPAVHVKEGGTVYDYVWYPYMNSSEATSCCWIASRQHEPIMMWDAFTSELRCTYRGYDAFDEVESAISVQFSVDGELVFGGYKKSIKIFQTNIPGRDYSEIKTKNAISCIAVSHSHPDTLICGTWKSIIYVYDIRSPNLGSLASLKSHEGGITYIKYSKDGEKLYSGARKDGKIYEWDMRNYTVPVNYFYRNVSTNQRIYFDLSPSGDLLGSGDTNKLINIWDIKNKTKQNVFSLHEDCINGFNFHPNLPIIGTSSGQYHFVDNGFESNDENKNFEKSVQYENSLALWWYGNMKS